MGLYWLGLLMGFSQHERRTNPEKPIAHIFYAIGNLGQGISSDEKVIKGLEATINSENHEATIVFLGNNASKNGFSKSDDSSQENLKSQIRSLKNFKGEVYYIPGSTDWRQGLKGVKEQQVFLDSLSYKKAVLLPKDGCPLKKIKIDKLVDLLILDSQWVLQNWDRIPNMNSECDIKSKSDFYESVEHEIRKSEGKTVIIAMSHPIASYGQLNGYFDFGINSQHLPNKNYRELSTRLLTIAKQFPNIVFLSGEEQNLQYILEHQTPIIISGASPLLSSVKHNKNLKFGSSELGFAKITSYRDGSLWLSFYGDSNNFGEPIFSSEVIQASKEQTIEEDYRELDLPEYVFKSIYEPEELKRSIVFKGLWGEHYRNDYLKKIKIKTAILDTLFGGLKPIRQGGGHQTNSIRLISANGKEFVMRSAKKSALRFIQYFLYKSHYLDSSVENTYAVELVQDYWTTANPFGSLTVADLSEAIGIYHSNPHLFYVPKQRALGIYNDAYGDKMYFIEERINLNSIEVSDSIFDQNSISTTELLQEMRRNPKTKIDESLYIRSRLFDNIIGDFDRHADQWRWLKTKEIDGSAIYTSMPRDRDQVFSNFDGLMLGAITTLNPPLRFMQVYTKKYKSVRWFNDAGDDVDLAVLRNDFEQDWVREARYLKKNLTEEVVDMAFRKFPNEIEREEIFKLREALLGRINAIEKNAIDYYRHLRSRIIVKGSDKKDRFVITRKAHGITNIKIFDAAQINTVTPYFDRDYNAQITKEIWIYGLNGQDDFKEIGKGNNPIAIKIIGGQDNDNYNIFYARHLKVFDQKSQSNSFQTPVKKLLYDDYQLNTYDFMKNRRDVSSIFPLVQYNPDDGTGVGFRYNYTKNSLVRNPFTQDHLISLSFFSATSGVEVNYYGEFAAVFNHLNLILNAGFHSPNYTNNFFGLGNQTKNLDDIFDKEFNQVRIRSFFFSPSLIYRGYQHSEVRFGLQFENTKVERTANRYIDIAPVDPKFFIDQNFLSINASYEYANFTKRSFPKKGIGLKCTGGYTTNLDKKRSYAYLIPELSLTNQLNTIGSLVFATKFKAHFNFNDSYEFYQAATIGANDGLRGFRKQRFSGNHSYYQTSDVRYSFGELPNSIIPTSFGVYAGFDYGRVWISDDDSKIWHTSQGGGLFFNLAEFTSSYIAYFNSKDGGRISFGINLTF
tara:strand:+ start:37160 stop:40708 length:3549 start_codon:yes stop_codon:yes gene_type:complete